MGLFFVGWSQKIHKFSNTRSKKKKQLPFELIQRDGASDCPVECIHSSDNRGHEAGLGNTHSTTAVRLEAEQIM